MSLHMNIEGVGDAIANIRRVADAVGDDAVRDIGLEALEPVAETARELAPVRYGQLRDSIVVIERLPDAPDLYDGRAVFVGPLMAGPFYAGFVEFGTVNMVAQPYLGPAIDMHEAHVFDVLGERLGALIESAAQ